MRSLARFLAKRANAFLVVVGVLACAGGALILAGRVEQDDDLLAFLPESDPDVRTFQDVNRRFGGLDVAIVGIEAPDAFAGSFLTRLDQATDRLGQTDGVATALSLTNVETFSADEAQGGVRIAYLVDAPPTTPAEEQALRARVLLRDEVVGQFVDREGRSVVILCFLASGADPRATAGRIRAVVGEAFPDEVKHWGGAPFISTYIYDVTERDLRGLAPWAVLVLVLITLVSFRNLLGTALALLSTALGILLTFGLLGALGVRSNVVLASMPVILFALGSAYAMHFLSRFYAGHGESVEEGIERVLVDLGPTLVATGIATAAALLSFVAMDIAPMRTFGLFTAIGLLLTLGVALTFVPAVLVLARLDSRARAALPNRLLGALSAGVARHRRVVTVAMAAIFIAALPLALGVEARMDDAVFFGTDSPPARAEAFLRDRFGGSAFLQVQIDANLEDPLVLAEVAELGDRAAVVPGVASVTHIGEVLALSHQAMSGDRVLPDSAAKARTLYGFLEGKRALRQLVTDDRQHALVQIKLRSSRPEDTAPVLAAVRALVRERAGTRAVVSDPARVRQAVAARLRALVAREGQTLRDANLEARLDPGQAPVPTEAVARALAAFLASDEFLGEVPADPAAAARAVTALGPQATPEALTTALIPIVGAQAAPLAGDLAAPLAEIWRRERGQAWARVLLPALGVTISADDRGDALATVVGNALLGLDRTQALGPLAAAGTPFAASVTGLPVMHQGLSRSVASNQVKTLVIALLVVCLVTTLLGRSLATGILAALPTLFAVAVVYATMTLCGIVLDLGTCLLASLTIGAGMNHAIHVLAAWDGPTLPEAARTAAARAGRGVWTNTFMVGAGFFVLTLGEARPLRNVGGLTAAAIVVSAIATFLLIPALARRPRYNFRARLRPEPEPETVMSPTRSP